MKNGRTNILSLDGTVNGISDEMRNELNCPKNGILEAFVEWSENQTQKEQVYTCIDFEKAQLAKTLMFLTPTERRGVIISTALVSGLNEEDVWPCIAEDRANATTEDELREIEIVARLMALPHDERNEVIDVVRALGKDGINPFNE